MKIQRVLIIFHTFLHCSHQSFYDKVTKELSDYYITPLVTNPCIRELIVKHSIATKGEGAMTLLSVLHESSGTQRELLRDLMENTNLNFMVKKSLRYHHSTHAVTEKARVYTFLVMDWTELEGVINLLRPLPTWNALAKVLVVFPFEVPQDDVSTQVEQSLKYLFETVGFYDILVMLRKANTSRFLVYSFFPYDHGNCARQVNHVQLIDDCEIKLPPNMDLTSYQAVKDLVRRNNGSSYQWKITEFRNASEKLIPQIPGCKVTVSVSDFLPFAKIEANQSVDKGIEVNLMKTVIERKMKAHIEWVIIPPKVRYSNFTVNNQSGVFVDLVNRKSSYVIGGFFRTAAMAKKLYLTPPTMFDDVTFCVHSAGLAPAWLNPFKTFEWSLWLGIIVTLFICGIVIFGFIKFEPLYHHQNFTWSLLTTFGFCIAMFTVHFEPRRVFIRIFISTLLLFGINSYAAYTSSLISILTKPRLEDQISTAEGINNHGLLIYGSINHFNYIKIYKENDPSFRKILKNFHVCETNTECFTWFSNNSRSAIVTSRKHAMSNRYSQAISKFCFDDKNNLFTYSAAAISYLHNHLTRLVDDGIYQAVAGGLIFKWESDIKPKQHVDESEFHIKLALRHLEGAFVLIGIGSALAIIAFFIEWAYFYYSKGRKAVKEKIKMIVRKDLKALKETFGSF